MSKPVVHVLRHTSEGLFVIKATDNIVHRPFTVAMHDEVPGLYLTSIRGLALLQMDHVVIDERPKP